MRALGKPIRALSGLCRFMAQVIAENRWSNPEKQFVSHCKKTWARHGSISQEKEILVEVTSMSTSVIALSYLANVLAFVYGAAVKGYTFGDSNPRAGMLHRKLRVIYGSFNVREFLYRRLSDRQQKEAREIFQDVLSRFRSKKDVEDLMLEGLWIGDLLYDSHCLQYMLPTVEIDDERFRGSLEDAVRSYVYWRDYFQDHDVQSVIVTHTVYVHSGVIARLAIKKGIPVYQINATHLYFLSKKNLWAYNDFFYYPEGFQELPQKVQKEALKIAKERLDLRFSGRTGVDMHYSTKSAYGRKNSERVLRESDKTKILVATHCFFDNPHPYGINLFPDFYEWLYFLGEVSKKTDYDWYIKTHPDFLPGNIPIIEEFIRRYPRFSLVPSNTSHLQLIEEGIQYGLTVYGTIGFEYAALKIPVINASLCNPHIRYNFNIHPRSIEEYERILTTLESQRLEIDINEVYEYYYMAFINRNTNNWLFRDYEGVIKENGGYLNQFGPLSYSIFLRDFDSSRHTRIIESLEGFISSKEYRFRDIEGNMKLGSVR
jgi:hypothetical protein